MRVLILAATMAFAFTSMADAATCKDPKSGKFIKCPVAVAAPAATTCKDPKTGRFMKCPAAVVVPAPIAKASPAPMAPVKAAKVCKVGKPCGNSCISTKLVCHKPA